MKRISIYLDEDHFSFLARESERKGMRIAKYIRELVQREMVKKKRMEKKSILEDWRGRILDWQQKRFDRP